MHGFVAKRTLKMGTLHRAPVIAAQSAFNAKHADPSTKQVPTSSIVNDTDAGSFHFF